MLPELERHAVRTCHLLPPLEGLNADPLLYGVAAGVAELFPLTDDIAVTRVPGSESADIGVIEEVDKGGEGKR